MRSLLLIACALCACTVPPPQRCPARGDKDTAVYVGLRLGGSGEDIKPTCVDKYPASRLDATAQGPGRDESYAVSQPGVIPWTDVSLQDAAAACGRGGKFLCLATVEQAIGIWRDREINRDPYGYVTTLSPIEDFTVPDQEDVTVVSGSRVPVAFPNGSDTLVYLGAPSALEGHIIGPRAHNDNRIVALGDPNFHHPLVGFRCCVDSRLWSVFRALGQDPNRVLAAEPVVPIAETNP